ncbi:MAG: efflux RND transporter periplasmic adaptor subunit [Blastocatellia bacterium]|nr:efflux RND transporter periplasmic adaptor subunit [Blastocatellia bacterium]
MSSSLLSPRRSDEDEENAAAPESRRPSIRPPQQVRGRRWRTVAIGGVALLALLLLAGILPRLRQRTELVEAARDQQRAMLAVTVAAPKQGAPTSELTLPATTQAIQETIIYARTGGYVRSWHAGMGQLVRAGQLLAQLDAPLTAQQLLEARQQAAEAELTVAQARSELSQAQASLEQAQAAQKQARTNLELARLNLERSKTLVAQGVVSQQDTDDKQALYDARLADLEASQANVRARQAAIQAQASAIESRSAGFKARQANVQRLVELQGFEKVTAPYNGTITARNIEVGVLINENGALSSGNGLFRIARLDTIRIFINVPQTYFAVMQAGLTAEIRVRELPDKVFTGKVIGTSHSLDPATRMLMAEVRIPNPDQQLLPGMYAQVKFTLPSLRPSLLVPVSALVVNADSTQLMLLRPDQTVHIQKVDVGRDFGKEVEILSGLSPDDSIITNPSDAFREGLRVQLDKPAARAGEKEK